MLNWNKLWPINGVFGYRSTGFKDPCALQESLAYSSLGSYTTKEDLILKQNKAEEIKPYLDGRCIYIVGMMGSGKTTMGQILATLLGYSFFDSDKLIEETVGGTTISDIFTLHGESFLREHETEVLRKLSSMEQNVISTGGGAVVKPINWKYMHKGIIVFLDVPIEVLARRLTAVGTKSRPLLYQGSGGDYVKTLKRLSMLWNERSELYTNAHIRISLGNLAMKLGHDDVCNITPTQVAIEALMQIESYIKK